MAKITIYVRDNCKECARALDIASWFKTYLPSVDVELVNTSHEEAPELVKGVDGPVYEIAGQYIKGNPGPEQLQQILKIIATENVN